MKRLGRNKKIQTHNVGFIYQTYLQSYKRFKYWISFFYLLLLIQVWIPLTLPRANLLLDDNNLLWLNNSLIYFHNNFTMEELGNTDLLPENIIEKKFRYQLSEFISHPESVHSTKIRNINSNIDSLLKYNLIDINSASEYKAEIEKTISSSIIKYKSIHGSRRDSLVNKFGDNLSKRKQLLKNNLKEFQTDLDTTLRTLFHRNVGQTINRDVLDKLSHFSKDSLFTYGTLLNIHSENFIAVSDLLKRNLLKTPYLDLPLSSKYVIIIILVTSLLLYVYTKLLYFYYLKLDAIITAYKIPQKVRVPNTKNMLIMIGFMIKRSWSVLFAIIFYTIIPLSIIGNYLFHIYNLLIALILIIILSILHYFLYYNLRKKEKRIVPLSQ